MFPVRLANLHHAMSGFFLQANAAQVQRLNGTMPSELIPR